MQPTTEEQEQRNQVLAAIIACVREDRRIMLPPFDPSHSRPSDQYALQSVGIEANAFAGTYAGYRYQFEGEEDLLHLIVTRADGGALTPEEGQAVASFLLPSLPSSLLWLKPGTYTQHFYFGHDELLRETPPA